MNIDKAFDKLKDALDDVEKDVMLESFERIKRRTPVQSGRAKAAWVLDMSTNEITNDLPYVGVLEFGSSDQAPNGMMRITAAEMDQMTEESFKKSLR